MYLPGFCEAFVPFYAPESNMGLAHSRCSVNIWSKWRKGQEAYKSSMLKKWVRKISRKTKEETRKEQKKVKRR